MVQAAPAPLTRLSEEFFAQAVLGPPQRAPDLALFLEKYGSPPLWVREPGFPTLVYIILEQQVSLASARALYQSLRKPFPPSLPKNSSSSPKSKCANSASAAKNRTTLVSSPPRSNNANSIWKRSTNFTTTTPAKNWSR